VRVNQDKTPDPKQFELFTAMSFVTVDPRFGEDPIVERTGVCIDQATSMQRLGLIHPDTVFDRVTHLNGTTDGQYQTWDLCGVRVVTTPKRLRSFHKTLQCTECGRAGNVFLIERHNNDSCDHYINLYSVGDDGMVLMTVDHILPDSWYGRYDPANFQTMCRTCNQKKRHVMSIEEIERVRADISKYAKAWVVPEFLDALLQLQLRIHETGHPVHKLELNRIMERYRKRIKHNTKRPEVMQMLVDMNAEIKQAVASQGALSCPSTNVDPVEALASTRGSWSEKIKRWVVSLAVGVITGRPDLFRSPTESRGPG
jgi:5-methylcytosine-specific restriction endonuclease McrA